MRQAVAMKKTAEATERPKRAPKPGHANYGLSMDPEMAGLLDHVAKTEALSRGEVAMTLATMLTKGSIAIPQLKQFNDSVFTSRLVGMETYKLIVFEAPKKLGVMLDRAAKKIFPAKGRRTEHPTSKGYRSLLLRLLVAYYATHVSKYGWIETKFKPVYSFNWEGKE